MSEYVCFRIGDAFTAEDELSAWVATIASAINDMIAAGVTAFPESPTGHETYGGRVGVAHFHELGKFLDTTSSVASVQAFVATLDAECREEYASIIATYREHKERLEAMRSNGVFHYPDWNPTRGSLKHGLVTAADALGVVKIEEAIGERRFLFAEEIMLGTMAHACQGETRMYETVAAASNAIGDFLHFADAAIGQFVGDRGTTLHACEPIDPDDWSRGWKYS